MLHENVDMFSFWSCRGLKKFRNNLATTLATTDTILYNSKFECIEIDHLKKGQQNIFSTVRQIYLHRWRENNNYEYSDIYR